MKKPCLLACLAAFALAACAKPPSRIDAVTVSSMEYEHLDCHQLSLLLSDARSDLRNASNSQNMAQAADVVGTILLIGPPSALFGDSHSTIAQYKGEVIAMERTQRRLRCT